MCRTGSSGNPLSKSLRCFPRRKKEGGLSEVEPSSVICWDRRQVIVGNRTRLPFLHNGKSVVEMHCLVRWDCSRGRNARKKNPAVECGAKNWTCAQASQSFQPCPSSCHASSAAWLRKFGRRTLSVKQKANVEVLKLTRMGVQMGCAGLHVDELNEIIPL